jgi:hypothetical protein
MFMSQTVVTMQHAPSFYRCTDQDVGELADAPIQEIIKGTKCRGMRIVIKCRFGKVENLSTSRRRKAGKKLVDWCVDFLLFQKNYNVDDYNKDKKYITIWSFIYGFLRIEENYDYWLMNFLMWNNIMEFGAGIRCGWWIPDCALYSDRILTDKRRDKIINWIDNFVDVKE